MENSQVWYIAERAEQLAYVFLSRRNDLKIIKQDIDYGLDFLISIIDNGKYTGKMFGVQVKAKLSLGPVKKDSASENGFKLNINEPSIPQDMPFPLCLFAFSMKNDEGYYRWLKEPRVNADGETELILNKVNKFKELSDSELDNIVSQINLWYEKKSHHSLAT